MVVVPAAVREAARVAAVDHSIRSDVTLLANLAQFGIGRGVLDAMLSQASTAPAPADDDDDDDDDDDTDGGAGGGGGGGAAAAASDAECKKADP